MNKLISIIFINLLIITNCLAGDIKEIPDSLNKGLIVRTWKTKSNISTVKNPELGDKISEVLINKSGVAVWQKNHSFLPSEGAYYLQIEGYLYVPQDRSYILKLQSNSGAQLFVDGVLINNFDGIKIEFGENDSEIYLNKGYHKIEILAFNQNIDLENREISLAWNKDGNENFDWIEPQYLFCNKKKSSNLKQVLLREEPVQPIVDKGISYSNSIHPSYTLTRLHDESFNPPVGGLDFMSDGSLIVCTWDSLGQVFKIKNALVAENKKTEIKRIAFGLAEPLGLKVVDDKIYVLQKQELTQLIDHNGDDIIDEYKTICNAWGATGNFHEFAFGLVFKEGFFYATLATAINPGGKSTIPQNKDRGKAIKIGLDGSYEVVASGLRTPNGIGIGIENEIFIADNQGDWLPSCKIVHLKQDAFYGSYSVDLLKIGALNEKPPVVWLPQGEIGNSATQPTYLNDGIYKGQMIHGDVTHGGLKRTFVEKIRGEYQGIVFPFMQGFEAGTNRLVWGLDGSLYVGGVGSNGNWGQTGKKWSGLEKIKYNEKLTFEILAVRAKANGMEIEFTESLSTASGNNLKEYEFSQWKYVPTMQYGGPKIDASPLEISSLSISKDRKKVFVELNNLKEGYVVYVNLSKELFGKTAGKIWANKGWYTLNAIPTEKGNVTGPKLKSATVAVAKATSAPSVAKPVIKEISDKEILALGPKLIDESGCLQCHAQNKVILGPSFKMINDKYNADAATIAKLTEKVYKGGSGVWGDQAMGANTHLNKDDIKKLVRYILALP